MRKICYFYISIVCGFILLLLLSSSTLSKGSTIARQFTYKAWQQPEGLPSSTILALVQTSDGYLWIGTFNGLTRFDGRTLTTFNKNTTPSLKSNAIRALAADTDGRLWIGSDSGLTLYQNRQFFDIPSEQPEIHTNIRVLYRHTDSKVYVGGRSLFGFIENNRIKAIDTTKRFINSITGSPDSTIWFAGIDGIYTWKNSTLQNQIDDIRIEKSGAESYKVAVSPRGEVYVSIFGEGLFKIHNNSLQKVNLPFPPPIANFPNYLMFDSDDYLWIGTEQGAIRTNFTTYELFDEKSGITNNSIPIIFQDKDKAMYIGTWRGGLNRLEKSIFSNFGELEGMPHSVAHCLAEHPSGYVLVGTDRGIGIINTDGTMGKSSLPIIDTLQIRRLLFDSRKRLWIGTYNGLFCFSGSTLLHYFNIHKELKNNQIREIVEDSKGRIWIGTRTGLHIYEDGKIRLHEDEKLSQTYVFSIIERKSGEIIISTQWDGIFVIKDNEVEHYEGLQYLPENKVFRVREDEKGRLWAMTGAGIAVIEGKHSTFLTEKDGLFCENLYDCVPSVDGKTWFLSSRGLFSIADEQIEEMLAGRIITPTVYVYGKSEGMRSPELSSTSSALLDRKGHLWFPTLGGAVLYSPLSKADSPPLLKVSLEKVIQNTQDTLWVDGTETEMHLQPGGRTIEFLFSIINFSYPYKIQIRYRLNGLSEQWTASSDNIARFTNLEPGSYTFEVQAKRPGENWESASQFSLAIYLEPHFWQTTWFLLLVAGSILSIGFAAYKKRTRTLKERAAKLEIAVKERTQELSAANEKLSLSNAEIQRQMDILNYQAAEIELVNTELQEKNTILHHLNKQKDQFLGIAAHDLKNPLTNILLSIESMERYYDKITKEKALDILQRTKKTVNRMNNIISNLLDINALETGQFSFSFEQFAPIPIAKQTVEEMNERAVKKNITLFFESEAGDIEVSADSNVLHQVFENLVSNAIKYSPPNTRVWVRAYKTQEGKFCFEVQDEGPGLSPDDMKKVFQEFSKLSAKPTAGEQSTGLGLSIVKKFVESMKGSVSCKSVYGQGATFIVELPLTRSNKELQ